MYVCVYIICILYTQASEESYIVVEKPVQKGGDVVVVPKIEVAPPTVQAPPPKVEVVMPPGTNSMSVCECECVCVCVCVCVYVCVC